jgi:putative multiple sugar transport system ATP-binding protein
MGAGRTELAMSIFGRSYGKYESARSSRTAGGRLKDVQSAIDHGSPT